MRLSVLVLIVVLAALAVTNPSRADFRAFAEAHSERLLRQETGDSALGRALAGAGASLASAYIEEMAERQSYVFFSTFTLDLDGPERAGNEWRFLGIGGQFVEWERPEALREEEGGQP